ncbi:hypothetical protein NUITMVRE18_02520 [Enterococcus faecium]|jgi:hypothetical protein|uniref:Uncharacterized protein n=3 Tax=Enterococcus faecium TaxID=1352 RepID=A0A1S8I398_ENTFC|nr:hypothetical protein HMPREF0351_12608 [Enterococcus faecium DO]EFR69831.1 hypothetical protein HMPREF9524_00045 [Enterococcus faecium TX0133a01]EFR70682.1 hypothetical protein HMPREF9526_02332 [Enterococcus faecium TX0133B]EFR73909.1 hypothetical protein HMPREF9523_02159 [Enterococcus faecium TX0133A]EFR77590.1 hypothetical protein HMPREF9527_01624 [Enterococcus faecium TX0133C]EFS05249.1 hypothetical protein HMPREF9525_02629 [Enterococcus faecium TX0133a04]EFS08781.1 hypothetical protein 
MVYFKIAEFLEEFVKKVFYSLGYVRIGVVYLGRKTGEKKRI